MSERLQLTSHDSADLWEHPRIATVVGRVSIGDRPALIADLDLPLEGDIYGHPGARFERVLLAARHAGVQLTDVDHGETVHVHVISCAGPITEERGVIQPSDCAILAWGEIDAQTAELASRVSPPTSDLQ